jgi:hypothetical protein
MLCGMPGRSRGVCALGVCGVPSERRSREGDPGRCPGLVCVAPAGQRMVAGLVPCARANAWLPPPVNSCIHRPRHAAASGRDASVPSWARCALSPESIRISAFLDGFGIASSKSSFAPARFQPAVELTDQDVVHVTRLLVRRVVRYLQRRGRLPHREPAEHDASARDEPLLAHISAASVAGRIALGPERGQPQSGVVASATVGRSSFPASGAATSRASHCTPRS